MPEYIAVYNVENPSEIIQVNLNEDGDLFHRDLKAIKNRDVSALLFKYKNVLDVINQTETTFGAVFRQPSVGWSHGTVSLVFRNSQIDLTKLHLIKDVVKLRDVADQSTQTNLAGYAKGCFVKKVNVTSMGDALEVWCEHIKEGENAPPIEFKLTKKVRSQYFKKSLPFDMALNQLSVPADVPNDPCSLSVLQEKLRNKTVKQVYNFFNNMATPQSTNKIRFKKGK